jgi:hypothetical protein
MSKNKPKRLTAEYRSQASPKQFEKFLDGAGVMSNRQEVAEHFNYDWHSRKLRFEQHLRGHILMQATAYESARDHQWAAENDPLFEANGAGVQISVSGLAQANKNRPIEPYMVLMQQVMEGVTQLPHRRLRQLDKETWQGITHLLKRVDMFDASVLKLPPQLAEWHPNVGRGETAAVKLQLKISGDTGAFKHIALSPATGSDSPYMAELLGDLDQQKENIFLFDGGYWSLDAYADIANSDNEFVTKRGGNIKPIIVQELPLPQEPLASEYTVIKDALVHLSDDPSLLYRMLEVELTSGKEITLLSSMVDAPADQICLLYRYRWTIEIVFRWLKQLLQLDHLMSHDTTGILRQILTALIVWGLLVIANQDSSHFSPKQFWRQLIADLHQAIFEFGYRCGISDAQTDS